MNCCLWIILLLACRGNRGWGCVNDWCGSGRNNCGWNTDECCVKHVHNDCGCVQNTNDGCGCMNHVHDDCECMQHTYDDCGMNHMHDDCDCSDNCMSYETYDHNDNRMGYETFGCQENGIPCPPPVPGNYMR